MHDYRCVVTFYRIVVSLARRGTLLLALKEHIVSLQMESKELRGTSS